MCLNVNGEGHETTGFFSVVSMCWHTPLVHVVTPTKGIVPSQVTKTRALTKSLRSPSPTWWSSSHVQPSSGSHNQLGKLRRNTPITKIA